MSKEYIDRLTFLVEKSLEFYNLRLKDEKTNPSDLLDYAESVIRCQKRLINALKEKI